MTVLIKNKRVCIGNGIELKPQPISKRPGYDMEHCRSVIRWHYPGYHTNYWQFFNDEKAFDRLSIIRWGESPEQWRMRVVNILYTLVSQKKLSVYHRFCLFAGFGEGKFDVDYWKYERPKIHNNNIAICFRCLKLFQVDDVKPKDSYHHWWRREIKMIEAEDLMQKHWDFECSVSVRKDASAGDLAEAYFNSVRNSIERPRKDRFENS
ncbi:unnamed protein product [Rhizophagus irregularis]|nr:unnamed protein product [Rhizophagus irregularis]CAB5187649.1 unnamed protein product [Rhizophagus irregularis]CAB5206945.1 unnamed protein product [Rhizophagus irregularis]CAB5351302.1 unnamed protein product [Rhizophagus irregularis]CAB5354512.1 unnamed protein product [Rhizophagus irregularis]